MTLNPNHAIEKRYNDQQPKNNKLKVFIKDQFAWR